MFPLNSESVPLSYPFFRYKEVRPGTGKTPTVDSPCRCHYAGRLIDGTEFDRYVHRNDT